MTTQQIAETILAQIPTRTRAELGTRSLLFGNDEAGNAYLQVQVTIKRGATWKFRIILTPADTYTVELWKIRGVNFDVVETLEDVYADVLGQCLEAMTRRAAK